MIATQKLRAGVLCVAAAAALAGVATRLDRKNTGVYENVVFDARSLSVGDAIGTATFANAVLKPLSGFRLKLAGCGGPAIVIPIPVMSLAARQLTDRAYPSPAYRATDVYRGQIREEFSHWAKLASYLAARAAMLWSSTQMASDGFYVRTYLPSDCVAENEAYVGWADAVLKLGHKAAQ